MKQRAIMTCEVSDPEAPVQWLFNNEPVIDDHSISTDRSDTFRSIIFSDAAPVQEGMYTCVTPDGRKTSAQLFVQKPQVKFIKELEDQECYMGDSVSAMIRLSVAGAGGEWQWDGERLDAAPGRVDLYKEAEEYRCKLYDVQETGSLAFVVAKNCSSICRITALERPIKFKRRLDDFEVDESESFTLECEMTVDKLEGFWTFEDEPIRYSDRLAYEIDGTIHRLHIKDASYDIVGKYGFKVGKKFTFSAVTMKEIEVDILSGPTDLQIKEGKQFCLSVVVSNPKASIQWRKDGRQLIGGEHFKFTTQLAGQRGGPPEGVRYVLEVEKAKITDEGLYTFDAQEGRATCTAKVHVKREPAVVTKELVAQKIRDSADFCEFLVAFSRPDVKIVWSRDNRVLRNERYRIDRLTDNEWKLRIENPVEEDSGLYCAECEDCSSHAMLRVLPWKTQIVDELEPKTGELNSKAEFMASVSLPSPSNIKPEEIEWFFDNEKVESEDERFSTNVLEEHLHTFTILKIEEEMMNKDVTLRIRDAETTAQLLVYIPPSPPKHVRIVSAKHDWAILQWDEPEARGSLPIIGYILECKVESGQWTQIGPELILGNRTEIDGLEGGLEHRFRVRAQTEYGIAAASLATDPLTPWVPLAVSKHLEEVTNCFEGDEKILKCKFTLTEEQEEAEWYLEDEKIDFTAEADRFGNACDGGHWRALKIKKAELDDSGLYMCRIGDHLTETILEVLPKPAEFKVGFDSGVAELNEDWEFKIEVDKPNQDVVWSKDGNQLHISGDKYITTWDDDFTHRLVIKNIQLEDQGHYLATIVGTESYCQGNLSVKVPEFQVKFESGTGDIGSDYTFKCQVDKPKAEVLWMKDGFELPSSDRYMVTWDDDFSTNLTIKNITLDDQGEYSAQIVDTPSICTAKLDIAVPTFDVAVRSGVADVGVDYTLNCKVDKSNVEVMWLKDGVKLPDSSRYLTSWDDDFSTNLTIKNCRLDDQGEYSAVIVGTPSISVAMLDVAVPQFKIEFENGQAELATDWTFECKANANVEVEWFKDGIKLPSLDRYLVSCDDDLNHMLTIKDVREDDEGEYEAKIINTPTSCKAKLNVAIPQFDFQLEKAEVKKGGSHTFKCSLERQEVGLTWSVNLLRYQIT